MHIGYYVAHIGHVKYLNSENLLGGQLAKWTLLSVGIVLLVFVVISVVVCVKRRDKKEAYKTKTWPNEEEHLQETECQPVGYGVKANSSDYLTQQTVEKQQGVYIKCREESNFSSKLSKSHTGEPSQGFSADDDTQPSKSVVSHTKPTEHLPPQVPPPALDDGYVPPVASATKESEGSVKKARDGYETPTDSAKRLSGEYLHPAISAKGYESGELHPDMPTSPNNQGNACVKPNTRNPTNDYIHPESAKNQSCGPRYRDSFPNDQDGRHWKPTSVLTHDDVYLHQDNIRTSGRRGDPYEHLASQKSYHLGKEERLAHSYERLGHVGDRRQLNRSPVTTPTSRSESSLKPQSIHQVKGSKHDRYQYLQSEVPFGTLGEGNLQSERLDGNPNKGPADFFQTHAEGVSTTPGDDCFEANDGHFEIDDKPPLANDYSQIDDELAHPDSCSQIEDKPVHTDDYSQIHD